MGRRTTSQVGSGMSRHTRRAIVLEPDDPSFGDDAVKHFQRLDQRLGQPWSVLQPAIDRIRDRWHEVERDLPDGRTDYGAYGLHFIERENEAWYLRAAIKLIAAAERAIDQGDDGNALRFAFELGDLMCEFGLKSEWGHLADQGEKAQAARERGARSRRTHRAADRVKAAERYLATCKSKRRAFALAAKELGCSEGSVRRDYYAAKNLSQPQDKTPA
jgi:hypothetical protein